VGGDGSQFTLAPRRWLRWDSTFHGTPDGSTDWLDESPRNPEVTNELKQTIIEGVLREAGTRSVDQLAQEENEALVGLLRLRAKNGEATVTSSTTAEPSCRQSRKRPVVHLTATAYRTASSSGCKWRSCGLGESRRSDLEVILDGLKRIPDGIR